MSLKKKVVKYVPGAAVSAVALICAFGTAPAQAADLGGNCCADLEERIAELEATTARKGNRKVSLTVSGWVTEQVVYWDDGDESNVYVTGLGNAFASNVNFTGKAQITNDVSAGYVLHIEAITSDVYTTNQDVDNGPAAMTGSASGTQVLYSYWFVQSEQLGRVSVGKLSPADDSAVVALDSSGTLQAAYWVAYDVFGFFVKNSAGSTVLGGDANVIWGNASSCRGYGGGPGDCNGVPLNVVRYDTPVIGGFRGTASWGEDDNWAVALRYINTSFGDWTTKGVVTYSESNDDDQTLGIDTKLEYFQASIYLQHNPSGWFAQGNYGRLSESGNPNNNPDTKTWYLKSGIRLKATPLGATIPYGEYLHATDSVMVTESTLGAGTAMCGGAANCVIDDSDTTFWGFGVAQEIDAAAMTVWLRYRQHELDLPGIDTEDMKTVVFGGFINF